MTIIEDLLPPAESAPPIVEERTTRSRSERPLPTGAGRRPDHQLPSHDAGHHGPAWLRAMRPRQWVKNGLVLAVPFAAGSLVSGGVLLPALVAGAVMCAAASATYLLNDIADRERDRRHPTKCHRPIASGELTVRTARIMAIGAGVGALSLAGALSTWTFLLVAGYLVMTISYSRWLKHVANVELGVVAAGFVLRVLVGATATATAVSLPFLIVVASGALFLAIAKRYAELHELGSEAVQHRPVLAHYTLKGLHLSMATSLGIAVVSYLAWALLAAPLTLSSPWLALSTVPVAVAASRAYRRAVDGQVGDPTELVLGDRVLQLAGGLAAAALVAGLYLV